MECNYSKNIYKIYTKYIQKQKLFKYLLSVLPKEKCLYSLSKSGLKFKKTDISSRAVQKGKFLFYNTNLTTELIFDIDNIENLDEFSLDEFYTEFYTKFEIPLTWSCKTDRGIQFCIQTNTFYQLSSKQEKVLKDFKNYIIENYNIIDKAGSSRLKGWWRNPLKAKEYRFYGNRVTFKEILEFLNNNNLTIKEKFKKETFKNKFKAQKQQRKIYFSVGNPIEGNRNNFVWLNTMLNTNSKVFENVLLVVKEFNKKIKGGKLDDEELNKIAGSVLKYNQNNQNNLYKNNKKTQWNIGSMGFAPIRGLSKEEYKKEVKRRQSMAGKAKKEIAKNNIEKYVRQKAEITKEKVYKAIEELSNKKEKVTVRKVKELANVSLASAQKYVKQAREEGIIP